MSRRGNLILLRPRLAQGTVLGKCQGHDLNTNVLMFISLIFLPWNTADANIAKILMDPRPGLWNLQLAVAQNERELSTSQRGCLTGLLTIENEWPDKDPDLAWILWNLALWELYPQPTAGSELRWWQPQEESSIFKIPEAAVPGSLELLESSWVVHARRSLQQPHISPPLSKPCCVV